MSGMTVHRGGFVAGNHKKIRTRKEEVAKERERSLGAVPSYR